MILHGAAGWKNLCWPWALLGGSSQQERTEQAIAMKESPAAETRGLAHHWCGSAALSCLEGMREMFEAAATSLRHLACVQRRGGQVQSSWQQSGTACKSSASAPTWGVFLAPSQTRMGDLVCGLQSTRKKNLPAIDL